jgi:hypothetical protein
MTPQRMLGNEFSHSGVRNRVTACRKRLREHRVIVRTHAAAGTEELLSEDAKSMSGITETNAEDIREPVQVEVGIT